MAGSKVGRLKSRTGFGKPNYKRGSMIAHMNSKKKNFMTTPLSELSGGKFSNAGGAVVYGVKQGIKGLGRAANFAGQVGKAFVRNATGGDIKAILKHKKNDHDADDKKKSGGMKCKMCGKTHSAGHPHFKRTKNGKK